ncbi:chromosome segregation protein SMC [archaeon]|nr:chromosome segregation protein SMC [archaeon]MBT6698441.1 chromosome segregation protein SMC [archaeon]
MTKILRLSLHGFKSFANKTDIIFGDKYNCILGPNGSGKSNVGDALCFVLGKLSAKSLRAEKAANLIFNGGKSKKPMSKGLVEIEFDNSKRDFPTDSNTVTISRIVKSKGTSQYLINKEKVTRTKVVDYLGHANINPDGYNIILQGDITRFVDMPSVERRQIIEQISDISHYEEKKKKAMQELNKAEDKLNDAQIVLRERKAYLRELKKDRDQALKFKELKDKSHSYRASYLKIKIDDKLEAKAKYDETIGKTELKVKEFEEKVSILKTEIEENRTLIQEINDEIEQKGDKDQVELQKDIEELKTSLIQNKTRSQTLVEEIEKLKNRKKSFENEKADLQKRTKDYDQKMQDLKKQMLQKKAEQELIQSKIESFKTKHSMGDSKDIEEEIQAKEKIIEEKAASAQGIRQEQQDLLREKDRLEFRIQTIDEQIAKVNNLKKEHKDQLDDLKNKKNQFKQAALRLSKSLDQDSSYASQISHSRKKLISLQEEHAKLEAKAHSIQANIQGSAAIQAIMDNKRQFSGVYGTVAQLGQVNKKYAVPLETLAGGRTKNLVVDTDETAAKCIKYLQSQKLGRASFIPLNKVRSISITPEDKKLLNLPGVHDFALNLINFKAEYKKAFAYVFGRSLVVEDLNAARKLGIGKARMATLDGSLTETSGVMSGGFRNNRKGSAFKERDSLERIEKLEVQISDEQSVISKLEMDRAANDEEITSLRKLKGELEGEIIKLEKILHLDTDELDASSGLKKELIETLKLTDQRISEIQRNISGVNRGLALLKGEKQMLRSKIMQSSDPKIVAQLSAYQDAKQRCYDFMLTGENEIKNLESQKSQLIGPELEKMGEIIKQHDKELSQFQEEVQTRSHDIKEEEADLKIKEAAAKEFYAKYKELFNKREKHNTQISTSEGKIENLRDKSRSFERDINVHALKNAEIKAKLSVLEEEFEQYKDAEIITDMSEKELYAQISKFEAMMGEMSAVNMKALEIYEQVEIEFNKLIEKKESLETEKTQILTLMNEIEVRKKEKFMTNFEEVNKHFQKIFTKLFKKGDAYLKLENKDRPFDDGMSIKVKITGKRHMDLKSLSGGEKTLTALAFIFAVQEHEPAKFYILDEIDAALDKHNAERLAKLLQAYSGHAQYVVVSHNDSIISEADNLYGVSMNDGISKITSIRI